jgi:type IV fimbrial biogenesis protein FimT
MFSNRLAIPPTRSIVRAPRHGLTMIEVLCAVCILATTVGLAVPGMQSWQMRQALQATAAELETDIQYARSEAVAKQQPIRLETQPLGNSSCYVLHTGQTHDCNCDGQGGAVCTGGAQLLKVAEQRRDGAVRLTTTQVSIVFDPKRGTVTPTATLKLADREGRAIHQVVNIMGRTRSCSPVGAIPGTKAC